MERHDSIFQNFGLGMFNGYRIYCTSSAVVERPVSRLKGYRSERPLYGTYPRDHIGPKLRLHIDVVRRTPTIRGRRRCAPRLRYEPALIFDGSAYYCHPAMWSAVDPASVTT